MTRQKSLSLFDPQMKDRLQWHLAHRNDTQYFNVLEERFKFYILKSAGFVKVFSHDVFMFDLSINSRNKIDFRPSFNSYGPLLQWY